MSKVYSLETTTAGRSEEQFYASELNRIINTQELSITQLAAKIEISSGSLSQIKNGEYEYNPDNFVWQQVRKFLEKINYKVYDTKLLKMVSRILNNTFKSKQLTVIASHSGAGKTFSAERYCLLSQDSILIRATVVTTVKYLLQSILKAFGQPSQGMNSQQLYETVSELVSRKNKLIVIDEADRLKVRELELIRDIYDQKNVGVCLMGETQLVNILKKGTSLKENLVRLYRRIDYTEVADILTDNDVKIIIEDLLPGNNITESMVRMLSKKFEDRGGVGIIVKICQRTNEVAAKLKVTKIDDELIHKAIGVLAL